MVKLRLVPINKIRQIVKFKKKKLNKKRKKVDGLFLSLYYKYQFKYITKNPRE